MKGPVSVFVGFNGEDYYVDTYCGDEHTTDHSNCACRCEGEFENRDEAVLYGQRLSEALGIELIIEWEK